MSGRGQRIGGASRIGCLVSLVVLIAVAYAGVKIAGSEIDFRTLQGEVQAQARLAAESLDETLATAISTEAARLGLPPAAGRATVQRLPGNRIRIALQYADTITFVSRWEWIRMRRIDLEQNY